MFRAAQHLHNTDDGLALRARRQKEAATSLEGRASELLNEADQEENTFEELKRHGDNLISKGRLLSPPLIPSAAFAQNTATVCFQSERRACISLPDHIPPCGSSLPSSQSTLSDTRSSLSVPCTASRTSSPRAGYCRCL
jgi:hypothetical protein